MPRITPNTRNTNTEAKRSFETKPKSTHPKQSQPSESSSENIPVDYTDNSLGKQIITGIMTIVGSYLVKTLINFFFN